MNQDILDYTYRKVNELEKKLELHKALSVETIPTHTSQLINDGQGQNNNIEDPFATLSQLPTNISQLSGSENYMLGHKHFGRINSWAYIAEKWYDTEYKYYVKMSYVSTSTADNRKTITLPFTINYFVSMSITQLQTNTSDNGMFQTMCNTKLTIGSSISSLVLSTKYEVGGTNGYSSNNPNAPYNLTIEGFVTEQTYMSLIQN